MILLKTSNNFAFLQLLMGRGIGGTVSDAGAAVGRILVVDDDEDVRSILAQFIRARLNCEVVLASSVDEALTHYDHEHFDVIVSDYQMPKSSGLDFANALSSRHCEIPFLMYTAHNITPWDLRKLHLVADVVQKPNLEGLLSIMSTLMGWRLAPRTLSFQKEMYG